MVGKTRHPGLAFGCALAISACTAAAALAKDPIKIGFMAPYVGNFAKAGKDMDNGFKLYLEEIGFKAGGRQLVMITEDDEAKPELGPTKARKLIDSDKVDILAGIIHSGVAISVRDIVAEKKIPLVLTNAGAADLTGKLKSPYIFRVSFANGQQDLAAGWYAYNKMGFRRVAVVAPDYSAGHEKAAGFMKGFRDAGGKVVSELYPPVTTTDFSPYLTKILEKGKEVDAAWAFFPGAGSSPLITQYEEYGLKKTLPLLSMVDDSSIPAMRNSALGLKSYMHYTATVKNPENEKFVKAYRAKYKEIPDYTSEQGYVGAKAIAMAIDAVKGDIENKEAFLAALRKVKFNAPRGPFYFDENQNVVLSVFIKEIQKINGEMVDVVLDTIPGVDQNWSASKMKR